MCGIVGIVEFGPPTPAQTVADMRDTLAHRGPDDAGLAQFCGTPHVWLAQRRLAIVGNSDAGRQPVVAADGQTAAVFNGEIYNFRELAEQLRARGQIVDARSDTQVVLAAYEAWGDACVERFNGMWALAVWDARRRRLFVARDRLGKKPLYYYWNGRIFAFASEIKALARHPAISCRPNESVLAGATAGALEATGQSMFADIRSLPAAHTLSLDAEGAMRIARYWRIDPERRLKASNSGEYVEQFHELFDDAVRLRLRAETRVGAMVSGGLDSSLIVGTVAKLRPDLTPLPTFSARFPEHPECDEGRFIDAVVRHNGLRTTPVMPRPEQLIAAIDRLHYHQETPFESTSIFAQWTVMKTAREHGVRVLLDGQGADEMLGGYPAYLGDRLLDLTADADLVGVWRTAVQLRRYFGWSSILGGMRKFAARIRPGKSTVRSNAELEVSDRSRLWRRLHYDTFSGSLPTLLRYADRNAMAFGIESRNPFLDYRLVEFLFALPDDMKIRDGRLKLLVREAGRDRLPPIVANREDKIGFAAPEDAWLRGPLRSWAERMLFAPVLREVRGYDADRVRRSWQSHLGGQNLRRRLWPWISLASWLEMFDTGAFTSPSRFNRAA